MLTAAPPLTLTPAELAEVTRCKRPGDQLDVLHRRGFHRAWRAKDGSVVLERAHYEAVCAECRAAAANEPRLRA